MRYRIVIDFSVISDLERVDLENRVLQLVKLASSPMALSALLVLKVTRIEEVTVRVSVEGGTI